MSLLRCSDARNALQNPRNVWRRRLSAQSVKSNPNVYQTKNSKSTASIVVTLQLYPLIGRDGRTRLVTTTQVPGRAPSTRSYCRECFQWRARCPPHLRQLNCPLLPSLATSLHRRLARLHVRSHVTLSTQTYSRAYPYLARCNQRRGLCW